MEPFIIEIVNGTDLLPSPEVETPDGVVVLCNFLMVV